MDDIRKLEFQQELLDNESMMLIRQKSYQLYQLVKSIQYQSQELEMTKFANLYGYARIQALETEVSAYIAHRYAIAANVQQISGYLNKVQQICDYLQMDNQYKAVRADYLNMQLATALQQTYTQQAQLQDAYAQLQILSNRNALFAYKNTLFERDLAEKEKDIIVLAGKCRSLVQDNQRISKNAREAENEASGLLEACRMGSAELLQVQQDFYRKIREKLEACALLERCCYYNLELRNMRLSRREVVRKQLLAVCRACSFISHLHSVAKEPNLAKQINQQQIYHKIGKLHALDFCAAAAQAKRGGSYSKEMYSASGVARNKEARRFVSPAYYQSETVLAAKADAYELQQLRKRIDQIQQQARDSSSAKSSLYAKNNMLSKQNEYFKSEIELQHTQIYGLQDYVADFTAQITYKNARLIDLEQTMNQIRNGLERDLREQTNRADVATAKVSALTETLDQREHRILALERDFYRVQARVRAKETELEGARRIVSGIQNVGYDLEGAIESKRQRLKDLEKQIEQW